METHTARFNWAIIALGYLVFGFNPQKLAKVFEYTVDPI